MDHARSDADPPHRALQVADLNGIADVDRPLEQQDQTRDKIIDDTLQAKADADAEGAGENTHVVEIHPEHAERRRQIRGR